MNWRTIQSQNFTKWEELLLFLELNPKEGSIYAPSKFPLNLPRRLAEKIEKNRWDDPILKQFLPSLQETTLLHHFFKDPVGDHPSCTTPKLLHKYEGRALLLATSACAMHCRFCFRQHFDYEVKRQGFEEELKILKNDASISEVLLSGGDPLSLSNTALKNLIDQLEAIPHVKRLRFHTRFPMGIPERIDTAFLNMLETTALQVIFTIHCNHAKELDREILDRLKKIQKLAIPILTQTVLLRGVNDNAMTLQMLFETLIDHGILPYYLHQLDRAQGTEHFEVTQEKGLQLIKTLRSVLPGYAIPQYVQEIAGEPNKTPL